MPHPKQWTCYGVTDIGKVRRSNQDAYTVLPHVNVYSVADGMGGHAGGEVASRLAIDSVNATFQEIKNMGEQADHHLKEEIQMYRAFEQAQKQVLSHARHNPSLQGMGTTLVILQILLTPTPRAIVGHIGDSRAYLYRRQHLTPLTRDHSLVEQYVERGEISPQEAEIHPHRHVLTQAIGVEEPFNPTVNTYSLQPHDLILLCTDGLTKMLDESQICQIFEKNGTDLEQTGKQLIGESLEKGGADNVTVVLCADYDPRAS